MKNELVILDLERIETEKVNMKQKKRFSLCQVLLDFKDT